MSAPDLGSLLQVTRSAVEAAGALALRHFRTGRKRWYKAPGQVVTEADLAIDSLLHERLRGACPGYGWLSEERDDDGSRQRCERVWVVDPIDGTRAFAEGVPQFAVSVALLERGKPLLGVVFNPATDEWFDARRGAGARLNDQPVAVSACSELEDAELLASRTEMKRRHWPDVVPEAEFTTIGSLAYKLALIASGRFDGLISLRSSHDWDIAAAQLLVAEAGGQMSDASGRTIALNQEPPRHRGLAVAGTARLHEALLTRLETADAS
ncbi:MAG: 3'(2'),5'-bisphosphate nucleotidase CysQ [Pseudomonadota bacterium]